MNLIFVIGVVGRLLYVSHFFTTECREAPRQPSATGEARGYCRAGACEARRSNFYREMPYRSQLPCSSQNLSDFLAEVGG